MQWGRGWLRDASCAGSIETAVRLSFDFKMIPEEHQVEACSAGCPCCDLSLPGQRRGACRSNRDLPSVRRYRSGGVAVDDEAVMAIVCGAQDDKQADVCINAARQRERVLPTPLCVSAVCRRPLVARRACRVYDAMLHVYPRPRDHHWAHALASDERSGPPTSGLALSPQSPTPVHQTGLLLSIESTSDGKATSTPPRRLRGIDNAPDAPRCWRSPNASKLPRMQAVGSPVWVVLMQCPFCVHSTWRPLCACPRRRLGGYATVAVQDAAQPYRGGLAVLELPSCVTTASPMHCNGWKNSPPTIALGYVRWPASPGSAFRSHCHALLPNICGRASTFTLLRHANIVACPLQHRKSCLFLDPSCNHGLLVGLAHKGS
jgi:hypothetical protein